MLYMPPLRYMQPEAADGPPCVNGSLHDEPNAGEVDDTLGVVPYMAYKNDQSSIDAVRLSTRYYVKSNLPESRR
jgi:hypothetical protein